MFSSLTLTLSVLQTQTRAFSVNCNFSPFSKSSCRELRHNSIFPTLPFLHLHTELGRNFFTRSENCTANLFAMGRFLWISAKVFSGKMALFLSLSEFRHKSGASSLTHTGYWHYRLFINLGPLAQFMYMLKHAKVVAERHIFFVPSDKTCFEDPLPPYHMILNLDPVISSFAVFCWNQW